MPKLRGFWSSSAKHTPTYATIRVGPADAGGPLRSVFSHAESLFWRPRG
jgi:hypothetical protein